MPGMSADQEKMPCELAECFIGHNAFGERDNPATGYNALMC
jgi:hypothetical protein